jgi:hypothetical protein
VVVPPITVVVRLFAVMPEMWGKAVWIGPVWSAVWGATVTTQIVIVDSVLYYDAVGADYIDRVR